MKKRNDYALMGKMVTVTKVLKYKWSPEGKAQVKSWVSEDLPEARDGWVVGYRWKSNGEYEPGVPAYSSYFSAGDEYDPPQLIVTGKVPCLMVAWWPTMNPVPVPMDGFEEKQWFKVGDTLDGAYNNAGYGEGRERRRRMAELSGWINEHVQRDERGRFKK